MFNLRLIRTPFVAAVVAVAALAGGCASGPDVGGGHDRAVDSGGDPARPGLHHTVFGALLVAR